MYTDMQRDVLAEILARLDRIEAKFDAISQPVLRVVTKKESGTEQAKRAECSIRTLQRRERRERIRLMAEGKIKPLQAEPLINAHRITRKAGGFWYAPRSRIRIRARVQTFCR